MGSLAGSIRAWDGRTRTSTDEHGQNDEGVCYFARPSSETTQCRREGCCALSGARRFFASALATGWQRGETRQVGAGSLALESIDFAGVNWSPRAESNR